MQALTLHQFTDLTLEKKVLLLLEQGMPLELYRRVEGCKVALYDLCGFYCEIWIHNRTNRIINVEALGNSNQLDLYLDQVNIKAVYALL